MRTLIAKSSQNFDLGIISGQILQVSTPSEFTCFVGFHMAVQCGFHSEGPGTYVTREWFLPGVDTNVAHQIARFLERLVAMVALVHNSRFFVS